MMCAVASVVLVCCWWAGMGCAAAACSWAGHAATPHWRDSRSVGLRQHTQTIDRIFARAGARLQHPVGVQLQQECLAGQRGSCSSKRCDVNLYEAQMNSLQGWLHCFSVRSLSDLGANLSLQSLAWGRDSAAGACAGFMHIKNNGVRDLVRDILESAHSWVAFPTVP